MCLLRLSAICVLISGTCVGSPVPSGSSVQQDTAETRDALSNDLHDLEKMIFGLPMPGLTPFHTAALVALHAAHANHPAAAPKPQPKAPEKKVEKPLQKLPSSYSTSSPTSATHPANAAS